MIWIAVCDGATAKIFKKEQRFTPSQHLQSFSHSHESTHEHGRDKPGRVFESGAVMHHAYETKSDWHDRQKETFIKEISSHLLKSFQDRLFSKLYFIAPAKLTNVFRLSFDNQIDALHKAELDVVEIHKDLTHCTTEEIDNIILKEEGWA